MFLVYGNLMKAFTGLFESAKEESKLQINLYTAKLQLVVHLDLEFHWPDLRYKMNPTHII